MADLVWREDTKDTTHGTVVAYSLWDRETNKRLGGVRQIEQRENGDFVAIDLANVEIPEGTQQEFNDLDKAKLAVENYTR